MARKEILAIIKWHGSPFLPPPHLPWSRDHIWGAWKLGLLYVWLQHLTIKRLGFAMLFARNLSTYGHNNLWCLEIWTQLWLSVENSLYLDVGGSLFVKSGTRSRKANISPYIYIYEGSRTEQGLLCWWPWKSDGTEASRVFLIIFRSSSAETGTAFSWSWMDWDPWRSCCRPLLTSGSPAPSMWGEHHWPKLRLVYQ